MSNFKKVSFSCLAMLICQTSLFGSGDALVEVKQVQNILILKKAQKETDAENEIRRFVELNPESPFVERLQNLKIEEIDSVLVELNKLNQAIVCFEKGRWEESKDFFKKHLEVYPTSHFRHYALWLIYQSSRHLSENDAENLVLKEEMTQNLETVLKEPALLPHNMRAQALFELAEALYDLKQYERAIERFYAYIAVYSDDDRIYDAHGFLAHCYFESHGDQRLFALHAKKALDAGFENAQKLNPKLIESYVALAQNTKDPNKKNELISKAKDLYETLDDKQCLSSNKLLDLALLFFENKDYASAVTIYEGSCELIPENEKACLNWAVSLGKVNQTNEQMELLESLLALQEGEGEKWTHRDEVAFYLADVYETQNEKDKALKLYTEIDIDRLPFTLKDKTKLNVALLSYHNLNLQKKLRENKVTDHVITLLEEINSKANKTYDPVHFQAAIEYGKVKSNLQSKHERKKYLHKYLTKKRKEMFTIDALTLDPEADELQPYLLLMDGYIASLESSFSLNEGSLTEAMNKRLVAKKIFNVILEKQNHDRYLFTQAKAGLKALNKIN